MHLEAIFKNKPKAKSMTCYLAIFFFPSTDAKYYHANTRVRLDSTRLDSRAIYKKFQIPARNTRREFVNE